MANVLARIMTLAAGAGMSGSLATAQGVYRGNETPNYTVERQITEAVEVRAYAPYLLAEVTVRGDRSAALGTGFRELAGFIFGGNDTNASISMTSPVTQRQDAAGDTWTVTFMMPRDYTRDTLPAPDSAAVRFVDRRAERHLVRTFSGFATGAKLAENEAALRAIAAANDLTITGAPILQYFDDPMTAPWMRRNEVAFVLD